MPRIEFSVRSKFRSNPRLWRSSGICAIPSSFILRALRLVTFLPSNSIRPFKTGFSPAMASTNSVCPLPSIPAIPTISPEDILKDTSSTATPFFPPTTRFRISRPVAFGEASVFSTRSKTSRPTIIRASSFAFVSAVRTFPTDFPSRITVTSSEIAKTSSSLCVMMMIVFPCSFIRRRIPKNSTTS